MKTTNKKIILISLSLCVTIFCGYIITLAIADFNFINVIEKWENKKKITLRQGSEYLILFFSPDCGTCTKEIAELKNLELSFPLPVIGISYQQPPSNMFDFTALYLGKKSRQLSLLYDGRIGDMFYVDATGRVLAQKVHNESICEFYLRCWTGDIQS